MAQRFNPADPSPALLAFLTARHLATLTTLRPDGTPHVVPVGFTFEPERQRARIITFGSSVKARNVARQPGSPAVLCQFEGARWLTLEGPATLCTDAAGNAEAEARYAQRYRTPTSRPDRVTIEIDVRTMLGNLGASPSS
ncbi:MAG: TIGR03618 family F420-dependent PPOX class oxidoreductase [Acidimicrobiales bacterium]